MESTEKCDAVISHFNGKFIKTPAGVPGKTCVLYKYVTFTLQKLTAKSSSLTATPSTEYVKDKYWTCLVMTIIHTTLMDGVE